MIGESDGARGTDSPDDGGGGRGARESDRLQSTFAPKRYDAMEAEQLNQIAGKIANLRERCADLRRYL
jgi:hypothetical protein